jgi:hypothetical protein
MSIYIQITADEEVDDPKCTVCGAEQMVETTAEGALVLYCPTCDVHTAVPVFAPADADGEGWPSVTWEAIIVRELGRK